MFNLGQHGRAEVQGGDSLDKGGDGYGGMACAAAGIQDILWGMRFDQLGDGLQIFAAGMHLTFAVTIGSAVKLPLYGVLDIRHGFPYSGR
jgi:hypothetical protein